MAALSLWVRRTWSRRWLGLLGLGLLIAVVGGITLAVTAGARRTASAFDRLQARSNAPTIQVELAQPDQAATPDGYADLPTAATLAEQIDRVPGVNGVAVATFIGAAPEHSDTYFAAGVAASRGEAPHDRLLAGRLPGRDQPDEVVINEPAVAAWHTGLGQTLRIHTLAHDQMATFVGEELGGPQRSGDRREGGGHQPRRRGHLGPPRADLLRGSRVPPAVGPADRRGDRRRPGQRRSAPHRRGRPEPQRAARSPLGRQSCGRPRRLRLAHPRHHRRRGRRPHGLRGAPRHSPA